MLSASEIKRRAIDTDRLLRTQIKDEVKDEHQSGLDDPMVDLHQIVGLSFLRNKESDQILHKNRLCFQRRTRLRGDQKEI